MRRELVAFSFVFVLLLPSVSLTQERGAEEALAAVIADHERLSKKIDPISAGREGDLDALRRLPDVSLQAKRATYETLGELSARLSKIDVGALSAESALNHALLSYLIALSIVEAPFDLERIAFQNDSGFHTLADYLARTTVISSREEADAWLARMAALPGYYDQNIANLTRGIQTKLTQPSIVVDRVIEVARRQAAIEPESSSMLLPLKRASGSLPEPVRAEYLARALDLVEREIGPMHRRFVEFLEREYRPAAREKLAWRSTPDGESSYRFLVRRETTTNLTPDEIHRLGLAEVARIRRLMEEEMASSGYEGTFEEFLHMLRTDPRFYAHTAEDLLEKASEIAKRADGGLPALFATLPRLTYGVRPVPGEIAEGYTTGRYWRGSMESGQAGGYMVNTSRLDQRPLYELPALTLHEAVPGHHLQLALAQELDALPYFRRNLNPTAFVEGWGLYAEFLGEEMGIYRDAYERFGRYSYEMWRACRLVADTGIHWLGWSIEEARRCFTENSALAPHNVQTELERYIAWPAQALAYKVGELRFRALRKEAERALGEHFDVRQFHDRLLLGGALPMKVLEKRVRAWIDEGGP